MSKSSNSCQGCVFAELQGKEQVGCHANMIETAKKAGVEIFECWNEAGEFYVLKRQCMFRRPQEWADEKGQSQTNGSLLDIARQEVKCRFSAIVVCDDKSTIDDLEKTINSLEAQRHKPEHVVVLREWRNSTIVPADAYEFMQTKRFDYWKIENLVDEKRTDRKAVELVLHFKPRPFFATFRAGREVGTNLLWTVNKRVTQEWFQFSIINNPNDPIDGVIVSRVVYDYFGKVFHELEDIIKQESDGQCLGAYKIQEVDSTFQ